MYFRKLSLWKRAIHSKTFVATRQFMMMFMAKPVQSIDNGKLMMCLKNRL